MSHLQQRKTASSQGAPQQEPTFQRNSPRKRTTTSSTSGVGTFLLTLGLIIVTGLATSWIVTDSLTFGYPIPNWRKLLHRHEITLTTAELAQYDGTDPSKPIYLAINGKVYDVSAGPQYYGKGGGYNFFSGKDAARAYITGCFQTHLTHDLRGLSEAQIKTLDQWTDFYAKHDQYFYVGKVIHDPIPEDAPIPEDCNAQTSESAS
ncbi:uncharacterized protein SPPG_03403 [Spizellomyces punctatus DAOM BR117]|uniref:Cytochrome b5 heme-binding domain-containing protein n=1 Tax=Spizellomyces punctatus (strain DAOM BR117) TaxID=645134 RepID=A0A0L0HJH7_SPIPD|nr:uncharacterized protein SPPG_03403 [Spizellomyces punctatus DAOM BR117]KND01606.1 hypothetical protein SPPG_03403 [Spizellomyces punctatus DAOM BR117]|eukprot:XP_016609645.1 hypothetical protein SPPG_03403 [Spizellomyces punctatus DAOM BR117]